MIRAFQWDFARQVERPDFLRSLLPRYAAWGYEELYLHLEDAVHYPSLPGLGRTEAWSIGKFEKLIRAAARCGIKVVPIVNLLGHTQYVVKHPAWRDLNELRDENDRPLERGQVCPLHPRTTELAELLIRDMAPFCTAGKIHVGLDESYHLGQCPRCRAEVARHGLAGLFAGHVQRLHEVARRHDLQLGFWADMLYFVPEAIPLLPPGLMAYDWYYYPFGRKPRVELFNFAERDLAPALRKQHIGYFGCPMNGAFRHEPLPVFGDRLGNIRSWWQRCVAVDAAGMLITSWEPNRLALETTTLVDAAAASLWLEPGHDDHTTLLAGGLNRLFPGNSNQRQARALLAADAHAFAGYARWQINERWDVFGGSESPKSFEAGERFLARIATQSWPPPLASSLEFRHYLARRDVFVRQAARQVLRWRRLLKKDEVAAIIGGIKQADEAAADFALSLPPARLAADGMWQRSRRRSQPNPNIAMLRADAARLTSWRRWLRAAARRPDIVWRESPMAGAWQLQFVVHNFAPALQRVVVEQRTDTGSWREVIGRFTIEFRAQAARPRTKIRREFVAPLDKPDLPLRIAVRGVGQVAISQVALINGAESRPIRGWRGAKVLGQPAPARGWPAPNWQENAAVLELRAGPSR
ncbi:MAG TPA: family 20 glycosylhydrolase [Lacunisphaera sp.]|nr:family 20 glycosylhydrolase [Lacunisphaera sp.]